MLLINIEGLASIGVRAVTIPPGQFVTAVATSAVIPGISEARSRLAWNSAGAVIAGPESDRAQLSWPWLE